MVASTEMAKSCQCEDTARFAYIADAKSYHPPATPHPKPQHVPHVNMYARAKECYCPPTPPQPPQTKKTKNIQNAFRCVERVKIYKKIAPAVTADVTKQK